MKYIIMIALALCSITSNIYGMNRISHVVDTSSGNGVSVWETGNGLIRASLLDGTTGVWGTAVTISDPTYTSHYPRAVINQNGAIAVIWISDNNTSNPFWLAGATFDFVTSTWNIPTVLSGANETIINFADAIVEVPGTSNEVSVAYLALDNTNPFAPVERLRGIFSPTYGTWATPVNIDP